MLKINLLPIRQLKKRAKARNQIFAAGVVFISILALLALVGVFQAGSISSLKEDIASKQREKKSFDKVVRELADLEKKRIDLNHKIEIINQLKTDSYLTVHIMDEVARLIDNNRMWLTAMSQRGNNLTINGYALDNQTIAQFMDNLKDKSPYIQSVDLKNTSLANVAGRELKGFSLSSSVVSPPNPEEAKTAAPKKK